ERLSIIPQLQVEFAELDPVIGDVLVHIDEPHQRQPGPGRVAAGGGGLVFPVGLSGLPRMHKAAASEQRACSREPNKRQTEKEGSVLHDLYILLNIRDL